VSCLIEFLDDGELYLTSHDARMAWEHLWNLEAEK
jgi:hypothetical protein